MNKKFLTFSLLGFLAIMFFAGVVSAADGVGVVADPVKDWFSKWTGGELSPNVAKFLFWALVSIVIYSIADNLPFGLQGKKGLSAAFSIIVGFLTMAYITPDEVYAIMTSYSALGFVLTGAIPFIILTVFSFTLATEGAGKQIFVNKVISWAMWAVFLVFMIYKATKGFGNPFNLFEWVIVGLVSLVLVIHGAIWAYLRKMKKQARDEAARDKLEESTAYVKGTAAQQEALSK